MKKALLILILASGFAAVSLSAWEPTDLTKFPPGMNADNWILNFGIGIDDHIGTIGDITYFPTFKLSFDKNVGLSDQKLPFFFGGLVGYSGYGFDTPHTKWFNHRFPLGFRVGYHFNWGITNLDTYAVATTGWIFNFFTGHNRWRSSSYNKFLFDIDVGARYFLNDFFGFWAEAGFGTFSFFDIGISFKF